VKDRSDYSLSAFIFILAVVTFGGCDETPRPLTPAEVAEMRRQLLLTGQDCKCNNGCDNVINGTLSGGTGCTDLNTLPQVTFTTPIGPITVPIGCYCSCDGNSIGSARQCDWDDAKATKAMSPKLKEALTEDAVEAP